MMTVVIEHIDQMADVAQNSHFQMEIQLNVILPVTIFVALNGDFVEWRRSIVTAQSVSTTGFRNPRVGNIIFIIISFNLYKTIFVQEAYFYIQEKR